MVKRFLFNEYAIGTPENRNKYDKRAAIMDRVFKKSNRFIETWISMFTYKEELPNEESAQFGNFVFEIDEENFPVLKSKTLSAVDYLIQKVGIKRSEVFFQLTNRSIWVIIPAKTFANYGMRNLHKIYKSMATEINERVIQAGNDKGLDLSIYRWNGLMRALGSYLKRSKRWVTKFELSDLEEAVSFEELSKAKFDNSYLFSDVSENKKAIKWFNAHVKNTRREIKTKKIDRKPIRHSGMDNFIEKGELSFNRNLHIYTTALYLKDLGFSHEETLSTIQTKFKNEYVFTREAVRTINSAFKGNKHFSPKEATFYLETEIFENVTAEMIEKETFIIPRLFIEKLQSVKANHKAYRLLIDILSTYQMDKSTPTYSLKGTKHKNEFLSPFELLKQLGIANYEVVGKEINVTLVHQEREVYSSYIVVPFSFIKRKVYKAMKSELVVLLELWKSGYKFSETSPTYYVNIKDKTLLERLKITLTTLKKAITFLIQEGLFVASVVNPTGSKKQVQKEEKSKIKELFVVNNSENDSFADFFEEESAVSLVNEIVSSVENGQKYDYTFFKT